MSLPPEPAPGCDLCPRLAAHRRAIRAAHPGWFNGAVASFGSTDARLLVLGLAPGLAGANRTGLPFVGDASGSLLFPALAAAGFAREGEPPELHDCMVSNAVRCLPPGNRPTAAEIRTCRGHLAARIAALPRLCAILCLGRVAHESLIAALGARAGAHPFAHGAQHRVAGHAVFDSYHVSRYNVNTGRLSKPMFEAVIAALRRYIDAA
ncbi:MAG: uracil-DNA glycosylase [Rhodobacteraceae bacterium]|nr:uracil-DNA glycosylase [Paracoccaceae bacterium]